MTIRHLLNYKFQIDRSESVVLRFYFYSKKVDYMYCCYKMIDPIEIQKYGLYESCVLQTISMDCFNYKLKLEETL